MTEAKQKIHWQAEDYDEAMSFVSRYGQDLIEWLKPVKGETVVDFGCGTGDLAAAIARQGASVYGLDISPEMVERARKKYPDLEFRCVDGTGWRADFEYDAVFSNAALHWMTEPEAAVRSFLSGLKPGGRLVAEFGGKGNVQRIVSATRRTLQEAGAEDRFAMPWYFPTIGEYAALLEKHGMEVRTGLLLDRPTKLENGEAGMREWLEMFGTALFPTGEADETKQWIADTAERLKDELYDGVQWTADYRRIRIFAVKI
ncbi:class I SAM-dependent methyltransferase [Cohnella cellulosilytica]|uniref:Class I SAM-dependent methyltransferase n=1 Tax=Cohnella cellulosilytica TaxID=986710 RepID=A0ABW2F6H4_9BACL